jgi:hypothetical protein
MQHTLESGDEQSDEEGDVGVHSSDAREKESEMDSVLKNQSERKGHSRIEDIQH